MNNSNDGRNFRVEEDALGNVEVPIDHLWGEQTERSHRNFQIGVERYRWGRPVIRALGILKKCAAPANRELGQLPDEKVDLIVHAAQDVIDGLARRRISSGGIPDGIGHPDQHERQ
jgi:fumarate hydratase, class II